MDTGFINKICTELYFSSNGVNIMLISIQKYIICMPFLNFWFYCIKLNISYGIKHAKKYIKNINVKIIK
jgi:hypothetical protein